MIARLHRPVLSPGDVDLNDVVDVTDGLKFMAVMNGPNVATPPPGGSPDDFAGADFQVDQDVDLQDLALLQAALQ